MLSAIVQFLRNFLCCIKDLELLRDSFLWDAKIITRYYDFPAPLNQTTPLEVMISLLQFYAFYSCATQGYHLTVTSLGKTQRIQRLLNKAQQQQKSNDNDKKTTKIGNDKIVEDLLQQSLQKEGVSAIRNILVGFFVHCIGLCFIWLTANSWHVTETTWIGGLQGLIHALTIQETCLLILLFFMFKDGTAQLSKSARMISLAERLQTGKLSLTDMSVLSNVQAVSGWTPFWESGCHFLDPVNEAAEEKSMAAEREKLQGILKDWIGSDNVVVDEKDAKKKKDDDAKEKDAKIRKTRQLEKASEILAASYVHKLEGYREYAYLVLNGIAFYGYFLGILCYYWREEKDANAPPHPTWVRRLKLGLDNATADWHGNFAGDFCWTVEPLVILSTPRILERIKTTKQKEYKEQSQKTTSSSSNNKDDKKTKAD